MRYYRVLLISIAILFIYSQPQNLATRGDDPKPADNEASPGFSLLWKKPVGGAASLAASPNGRYVASVDRRGEIRCLDEHGNPVWKTLLEGVDRVVLSSDGSALAYTFLNPARTQIHLIAADGEVRWEHKMDGAAWSAAASPENGVFAVGTGERYCYVFTLDSRKRRYRRWQTPGAACSLGFSPDGRSIVLGTWQDAGIGIFTPAGKRVRWRSGTEDRRYSAELSPTGGHMAVVARPNRNSPQATVQFRNSGLESLWIKDFPGYDLSVDLSTNAERVAVGYERIIAYKKEEIRENKIALFNRGGDLLWEKGGLFGKWNLLQVCNSGRVLVYDESPSIYALSESGKILGKRKLPASVRSFVKTPSRKRLFVYCGDGELYAFAAD